MSMTPCRETECDLGIYYDHVADCWLHEDANRYRAWCPHCKQSRAITGEITDHRKKLVCPNCDATTSRYHRHAAFPKYGSLAELWWSARWPEYTAAYYFASADRLQRVNQRKRAAERRDRAIQFQAEAAMNRAAFADAVEQQMDEAAATAWGIVPDAFEEFMKLLATYRKVKPWEQMAKRLIGLSYFEQMAMQRFLRALRGDSCIEDEDMAAVMETYTTIRRLLDELPEDYRNGIALLLAPPPPSKS